MKLIIGRCLMQSSFSKIFIYDIRFYSKYIYTHILRGVIKNVESFSFRIFQ